MKSKTTICALFAVMISLFVFNASAFADQLGVVDLNKILQNYSLSQNARNEMKIKKDDLQKFVEGARKSVQAVKTPTEKKKLEDKYNAELRQKVAEINKDQAQKVQKIQINVYNAIKVVAAQKQIPTVLNKQSVIIGGEDFTDEVIKSLNVPTTK